ncbi:MAG: chromosome segregation protein SMC [Thermoflexales bacterium]|nr:chromosome segregation protein SMC [Thermoflexales bacterium]
MRLKHVELQGFKSFASKNEFVFPTGVTAIVGPNGSGKSNIADAIRWVLGEQSFGMLRAKRTDELIFSGSEKRPQAGMASVSLTLDNSEGWLPIAFSEVTIGRQATRDGQNKYFLNGSQVRLRDIGELLSQTGLARRTYAVVGQGLVDQALSLRPEERRALFEEAAGIGLYQSKREDALRKLEETQRNLERVADILAEIGPRLHRLERQVERSQEYKRLSGELHEMYKTWYGYHWGQAQATLHLARASAGVQGEHMRQQQAALDTLSKKLAEVREQQSTLRAQLHAWQRQAGTLRTQVEAARREQAVLEERRRALEAQMAELDSGTLALQDQRTGQAEGVSQAQARLDALRQEAATHTQAVAQARLGLRELQSQREQLNARRGEAQKRSLQLAAQVTDRRNRRTQLAEGQVETQRRLDGHLREQAQLQDELARQNELVQRIELDLAALAEQAARYQQQLADVQAQISTSASHQAELDAALAQARARETELRAQLDALGKVRAELGDYSAGAQAVMKAGIPGIRGALVTLITVPEEWERAIEAALGPDVQAVIADTWQAVMAAHQCLGQAGGHAGLLALDLLAEGARLRAAASKPGLWQRMVNWLNALAPLRSSPSRQESLAPRRAADVVTCEAAVRPALEALLSNTLLVADLATARTLVLDLKPGEQLVTPKGDVLRANGTIWLSPSSKNEPSRGSSLLAREREWRGLPAQLSAAERQAADIQARRDHEAAHQLELGQRQADLARTAGELDQKRRARQDERDAMARAAERLEGQIGWEGEQIGRIQAELQALHSKDQALETELGQVTAAQASAESQLLACDEQLAALPLEERTAQLAELQTAAAVAEQAVRGQQAVLNSQQGTLAQLDAQLSARARRSAQVANEQSGLDAQLQDLQARNERLSAELAEFDARIQPAETRLEQLDLAQSGTETEESASRVRIRDVEARHSAALLEVSRREAEINALRGRIDEDLGLVELEMSDDVTAPLPLPLHPIIEDLPTLQLLPEGLEESIQRRKAALRRLGPINAEAQSEYQEALERHTFLTTQSADLEQAIASLHQIIAELDELMQKAFMVTFEAIAAEFKQTFSQLFGGGTARVVLTDPENLTLTGIDIVARPPGKRQQGLALLSGGERSLTAAALLFAILKVRPTPFCVLDEVDAALDESNVVRFRDKLKEMSNSTQFVLITHNRGTIEAADTVYGVTMKSDHTSQVLSYRLDEVAEGKI